MKKILYIIVFMILCFLLYADNIFSPLVVIEERKNGRFQTKNLPFTETIFSLLWDHEILFFDKKLEHPIQNKAAKIDPQIFAEEAKLAGADSLILLSIDYVFVPLKENNNFYLLEGRAYFTVYTLSNNKTIIDNSIDLADILDKQAFNALQKDKPLKQLAFKLIKHIL